MATDDSAKKGAGKRSIISLPEAKKQEVEPKPNDPMVVEVVAMHEASVAQHGGAAKRCRANVFDPVPYSTPPKSQGNFQFAFSHVDIVTLSRPG
jgi:hypothetical protein